MIESRNPKADVAANAPRTMSVPEAGKRYFGMERGASYYAARNGGLPTVAAGKRKLLANVDEIERRLAGETPT